MTSNPELQEEKGLSNNKKVLLALISLAGGEVEQFARLRIAVSMLKGYGLHTYKFEGLCPLGYGDSDFHEDVNTLGVYVNYSSVEEGRNIHRVYELNELGKSYGKEFANIIQKQNITGYNKLYEVAKLLSDSQWTAIRLNEQAEKKSV